MLTNGVNEEFHPARPGVGGNYINKEIGSEQNNLCNQRLYNSV